MFQQSKEVKVRGFQKLRRIGAEFGAHVGQKVPETTARQNTSTRRKGITIQPNISVWSDG